MKKKFAILSALIVLSGCSTFTPTRNFVSVDNNVAIKSLAVKQINVGPIAGFANFSSACGGASLGLSPHRMA